MYIEQPGLSIPGFLCFNLRRDVAHEKKLTEGGFGIVYLSKALNANLLSGLESGNDRIVVKESKIPNLSSDKLKAFYQEVAIMYLLRDHKNIVRFHGFTENPYSILLKYYPDGSLTSLLLSRKRKLTKRNQTHFTSNIASALKHIASRGIAHRDLKPDNILLHRNLRTQQLSCVITDFGISCPFSNEYLTINGFQNVELDAGSVYYASGEAIANFRKRLYFFNYHPFSSDLYSFSMIIYEVLHRCQVWE